MEHQEAKRLEKTLKSKISKFRRWKKIRLSNKYPAFSIMTYNILSQTAVENHRNLYKHCHETFLQEKYRISRIMKEILRSKSDIICLQEVEQQSFDHLIKKRFNYRGFESIFKKRTGDKSDGCAILWNKKKFDLLKYSEVEFTTEGHNYLDRDNVGLIVVLKPIHPDSGRTELHVATTHLIFNPKRGEIKLCQLRMLLAKLERMALRKVIGEKRIYHPTILCGDFNLTPGSPLYQFIETGSINLTGDMLSGNLSGQSESRNRGQPLNCKMLSLQNIGISDSSRYENKKRASTMEIGENSNIESYSMSHNNYTTNNSGFPVTAEIDDPSIVAAIETAKDLHGLTFLNASGKDQLAYELGSRISSDANSLNKDTIITDISNPSNKPAENPVNMEFSSKATQFTHDFKFVPVYKFHHYSDKDMPITSMTGHDFTAVDNIFYNVYEKVNSDVFREGKLRLLSYSALMRVDEIKELGGLPNARLGSDHLALIGQFALRLKR